MPEAPAPGSRLGVREGDLQLEAPHDRHPQPGDGHPDGHGHPRQPGDEQGSGHPGGEDGTHHAEDDQERRRDDTPYDKGAGQMGGATGCGGGAGPGVAETHEERQVGREHGEAARVEGGDQPGGEGQEDGGVHYPSSFSSTSRSSWLRESCPLRCSTIRPSAETRNVVGMEKPPIASNSWPLGSRARS